MRSAGAAARRRRFVVAGAKAGGNLLTLDRSQVTVALVLLTQRLVGPLRLLLAVAFAALLFAQLRAVPAVFDDWARDSPELGSVGWLLAGAAVGLGCVQVVVLCTWRLLSMVEQDRIFSDDALPWVNAIIGAMAAAWLLLLAALLHAAAPGGPSSVAATVLALLLVAVSVAVLLMVVMRALLRQATRLRTEMDAVV